MFHRYSRIARRILAVSALLLLGSMHALPAAAQSNRDATVAFYLVEGSRAPGCTKLRPPACDDPKVLVDGGLFTEYYAVLCVFGGDPSEGIAGVGLGIDYDAAGNSGVDALGGWTNCGTLDFQQEGWPAPGTGIVITWDPTTRCQTEQPGGSAGGVTAVAGYFPVWSETPDRLLVVKRPVSGVLSVADCTAEESILEPEHGGTVGFSDDGTVKGYLPCRDIIVTDTTWGTIKSTYENR